MRDIENEALRGSYAPLGPAKPRPAPPAPQPTKSGVIVTHPDGRKSTDLPLPPSPWEYAP